MFAKIREKLPDAEFILVVTMLGNPNWTRLAHGLFPQYRDALAKLCEPGIAPVNLVRFSRAQAGLGPDRQRHQPSQ